MRARMWGKRDTNPLLVGMQTGQATVEVSLEIPQKPEYNPTVRPSHPTPLEFTQRSLNWQTKKRSAP